MKQKTVRFYEDAPDDNSALEKLNSYKKYGFNSSREMIIAAINSFSGKNSLPGNGSMDMDELAEMITQKLVQKNFSVKKDDTVKEKNNENNNESNDDTYQKALSFMETL